jgi:2,3-diaminopropionate biosynthesis protein SbnA
MTTTPLQWNELIGSTPLLRLERLLPNSHFNLYAKLEMSNIGGSMKDRSSYGMLAKALEQGTIQQGSIIVESSSGNMGIGLAQACLRLGLKFICITDSRTSATNIKIMQALGATVEIIQATSDDLLSCRLERVHALLEQYPGSYWPNQYANPNNAAAYHSLMEEVDTALMGRIDFLFCATGTCGTIRGCSEYIKQRGIDTQIVAVDAVGSVIFGQPAGVRKVSGHGAAVRPALYQDDLASHVEWINDKECITGCHDLLQTEAILAGGSSGAVVAAVQRWNHKIPKNSNVVAIFADKGERYLDTIYNGQWASNIG